jgi:hypothetical protein
MSSSRLLQAVKLPILKNRVHRRKRFATSRSVGLAERVPTFVSVGLFGIGPFLAIVIGWKSAGPTLPAEHVTRNPSRVLAF